MPKADRLKPLPTPEDLSRISPAMLARLLMPFQLELARLEAGDGDAVDIDVVRQLVARDASQLPATLINQLGIVSSLGTESNFSRLLDTVSKRKLSPPDQPTAADLAIVLLHGAPDALERIFAEQLTFRGRRLRTHLALCDTAPQVTNVPDHLLESIRVSLDEHFEARGRGRGVRVFAVTTDGGFRLLIRRGDPLHREATIDPDSGDTRHIAFHRERYDMAIYKCRDGELQLNARDDTDVEAYLTAIGYFIFNDQTLFLGEGLPARYTLEPIVQHGADCLDVGGVPGLKSVRMTSVEWYHGKASGLRTIKRASDIFGAFLFERETIPRGVKLTAASFRLQFTDRRETSVRIVLPNNAVIGRDVDAEAVRQWLILRGFVVDREEANRGLTRSLLATS